MLCFKQVGFFLLTKLGPHHAWWYAMGTPLGQGCVSGVTVTHVTWHVAEWRDGHSSHLVTLLSGVWISSRSPKADTA